MNDGRRSVCENKSPLIDIIVAEVLLAHPGRVFKAQEIYQELVARQLYRFSDDAKTPCNSICTRLSTGIQNRFPRLRRAGRGEYMVKSLSSAAIRGKNGASNHKIRLKSILGQ